MLSAKQLNRDEAFASWGVAQTTYQVDFWTHQIHKSPDTRRRRSDTRSVPTS